MPEICPAAMLSVKSGTVAQSVPSVAASPEAPALTVSAVRLVPPRSVTVTIAGQLHRHLP